MDISMTNQWQIIQIIHQNLNVYYDQHQNHNHKQCEQLNIHHEPKQYVKNQNQKHQLAKNHQGKEVTEKSHASSLGIMTSSPPSSTVSATPAMDQDKDAIKKDTNVIMKGKDAIGHDKCGIKVIGIIEKKKKIKNLGNEKAPQKIQQAAQEHMSGGKKAINGMDCD
eukprot:506873_1